jgi:molecular chaperone HscC
MWGRFSVIVGIDLGTTNSAVAIWRDGAAQLIPNALGDLLTPSAVSIGEGEQVIVGLPARDRRETHPERTATAFKRLMGTQQRTKLGRHIFDPEQLSALVLGSLKADAEAFLGEPVTEAVITVPAYFNDRQRKATRRAGELAGLNVRRLLNEPTAAALSYGLQDRGEKEPFLVFDLGGGTFDVSIVEIFDGIIEVRASAGDNRLGGEDFNDVVVELARKALPSDLADSAAPRVGELMRAAAERTRRALSDRDSAEFVVTMGDRQEKVEIAAAAFEAAAEPLIARLRDPVLRSLRDSGIMAETLSEVVMVGGATRMPIVRRAVTRMFGRFPDATINADHAIALGAAVQAGLLGRDAALDEVRLTDVCPFTLGVDHAVRDARGGLQTGIFSPIIERNTPIPASRVNYYHTVGDHQKAIVFDIYQGEAREVKHNVKLGTMRVPVPPKPAGEVGVECRFSYDTSGLLEVDVTVPDTDLTYNLVIFDEDATIANQQLDQRRAILAQLKTHPRDDAINQALMTRAARCYESFIGERREMIGHWILQFEAVLSGQDPRAIEQARQELTSALDQLEGERFL